MQITEDFIWQVVDDGRAMTDEERTTAMNNDGSFKARLVKRDGLWWSKQSGTIGTATGCASTPLDAYLDMHLLYCQMRDDLMAMVRKQRAAQPRKVRA